MNSAIGAPSPMVVMHNDPGSSASEAFRMLHTNLQFLGLDEPIKSILMTSATPGEGKSTTTANLAVAYAQSGARVCLIDADVRRPTVGKTFGVENWSGLTTALIGQNSLEDCLQETAVPGLTLLTSGPIPPNPAQLLGSARMAQLISDLEERFDMVLVDTPPVLAVTDAALLAPKVGGVLLVTRAGKVTRQQAVQAKTALEAVRANMLGVVLTALQRDEREGYYNYYTQADDAGKHSNHSSHGSR